MKKQRKVIHLEIEGQHHYFGSLKALCDRFGPDQLGMSYATIRNQGITPDHPFHHPQKGYIIREGYLEVAEVGKEENN